MDNIREQMGVGGYGYRVVNFIRVRKTPYIYIISVDKYKRVRPVFNGGY